MSCCINNSRFAVSISSDPSSSRLFVRQHVRRVYAKYGENVSKAAAALKIARNTLRKYL